MAPDEYRGFHVDLDRFAGPLDLLLSLIRRDEVDIFDIPIARITDQYLAALEAMRENRVELSGEFLVMAATLMQIKSRMLLPRPEPPAGDEDEGDPRRELVELLLEYQRYRDAAELLDGLAGSRQRLFGAPGEVHEVGPAAVGEPTLNDLFRAYARMLERAVEPPMPQPREVPFTVADAAARVRQRLSRGPARFDELVPERPTRVEVVVTFMAVLELIRYGELVVEQDELFGEMRIRRAERTSAVA